MSDDQIADVGDPEKPVDTTLLERWALDHLARFATSTENLRRVLSRRARRRLGPDAGARRGAAALIDALLLRYVERGLLDDAAYAAARARARLHRGDSVQAIRAGLLAKGVDATTAAAAIAGLSADGIDPELAAACAFARRRRLGPYRRGPTEPERDLVAFARAGFSRRVAQAVLSCADPDAADALARDGLA
ncbi:MAG: RecX family transcriptional regulator [Alphaproteobacteria bacterium]|nr:RecX family transcriptional regulator [Alphaproteobacteria bacterium]